MSSPFDIRFGLNGNVFCSTGDPIPDGWLTKHETGELIRRAGREAGFRVESEWKAPSGRIDWVWFDPGERAHPSVAFEIEGIGVYNAKSSLESDRTKLMTLRTHHRCVILFHIDHNFDHKPGMVDDAKQRVNACLAEPSITVLFDYELWHGGIERIANAARAMTLDSDGQS